MSRKPTRKLSVRARKNRRRRMMCESLESRMLLAVDILATKIDIPDNDPVNAGDTILYDVIITNSGDMDALDVEFADALDPNTTLIPGSIGVTAIPFDDTYEVIGNTTRTVDAGNGFLSNDVDPNNLTPGAGDIEITMFSVTRTGGSITGLLTPSPDGSFTYEPPAGLTGTETFTYTVTDNVDGLDSVSLGLVTFTTADMIWYVDDSAPGGGVGTLASPFDSLTPVNNAGSDADAPGETIFVFDGSYSTGIALESTQSLIGEGTGLTRTLDGQSVEIVAAGTAPTITSGVNGIDLATGNTVRGLNIGNTTGAGIFGTGVGTATVSDVSITGTGQGVNINTGTLAMSFDEISSSNAAGITLSGVGGDFDVTTGTIDSGASTAVSISGNPIDLGVTFASVSVNGATNGINLNNTTGSFTIAGDGGTAQNNSGGVTQNTSSDGISLVNATNITLNQIFVDNTGRHGVFGTGVVNLRVHNSLFEDTGNAADESAFDFETEAVVGDNNISGVFLLDNVDITRFFENAVTIYNEAGNLDFDVINGSDFTDGADTTAGAAQGQAIIVETELTAGVNVNVDGGTFDNIESDAVRVEAGGSGANNVTVRNILSTNGGGPDNNPNGGSLHMIVTDASTLNFDLQGNTLNDLPGDGIIVAASTGGGNISGRIGGPNVSDGNTINGGVDSGGFPVTDGINVSDIGVDATIAESMTLLIQNNTIDTNGGDDGIQFAVGDNDGTYNITIADNEIRETQSEGIRFFFDDDNDVSPTLSLDVIDNSFLAIGDGAIELATRDSAIACANISGNDNGSGGSPGTILLDERDASSISVSAASSAALATANNGAAVTVQTNPVTFGATCTTTLPSHSPLETGLIAPPAVAAEDSPAESDPVEEAAPPAADPPVAAPADNDGGDDETIEFIGAPIDIGTLPAGKAVGIIFDVTVNAGPFGGATEISNQGTVSGTNFADVLTDDPDQGGAADPTTTPLNAVNVVNIALNSNSASEAAGTVVTVRAQSSMAVNGDQTVDVEVTGTGITAGDFILSDTTITILNGQTSGQVTFTVQDDALVEAMTEQALITISNPSAGVTLGPNDEDFVNITDNDSAAFSIFSVNAPEEGGTLDFLVNLNNPVDIELALDVIFSGGDATGGGVDYDDTTIQLTFPAGTTTGQTASVPLNDDTDPEVDETFNASLSLVTAIGSRDIDATDTAVGRILDNDGTLEVNLSLSANAGTESGGSVVTVTATAAGNVNVDQTVDVAVTGSNVDAGDFVLSNMTITIPSGSNSGNVTFTVQDDGLVEALTETATVAISNPSSGLFLGGTTSDTIDITDNDSAVVTLTAPNFNEGTGAAPTAFPFTVNLSAPVDVSVDMTADTVDGTATAADDFTAITGAAVSFAPGTTTPQTVTVPVRADFKVELDQAFDLALSALMAGGRNVTFDGGLGTLNATTTIFNDDFNVGAPPPIIDDSAVGFNQQGTWTVVNRNGNDGNFRFAQSGTGANSATWAFDIQPGRYRVQATWRAWPNRATNAPFTIRDGSTPIMTVPVDQIATPLSDYVDPVTGLPFQTLGEFDIATSRLAVDLSDFANGLVVADAIRVELIGGLVPGPEIQVTSDGAPVDDNVGVVEFGQAERGTTVTKIITIENLGDANLNITSPITVPAGFTLVSPPNTTILPGDATQMEIAIDTATVGFKSGEVSFDVNDNDENPFNFTVQGEVVTGVRIIDNGGGGFTPFAGGTTVNRNGHQGDFLYANSGTGANVARWTFNVDPGTYVVAAAWRAFGNRATNAPYTILDGGSPIVTVPINQQVAPTPDFVEGPTQFDRFQTLGTFSIVGNQLVVELSDTASGLVVADAIRIERIISV